MADDRGKDLLDDPGAFLRMGQGLIRLGRGRGAMDLAARAAAERPADPLLRALSQELTASGIAEFHGAMLADAPRNRLYREAIEAAAPGQRVLDIGTGSGLLAMMAARAGAAHVYACERDPRLAVTAREIVAANGLADRVTVLAKPSGELDRAEDLDGGVDLVVSEIFGSTLIDEGVLATLQHARDALFRGAPRFLPSSARIRTALVECDAETDPGAVVEGFDLSLFARHLPPRRLLRQSRPGLVLRSEPADLFAFGFDQPTAPQGAARAELICHGGRVTGIAQWISFTLAPGLTYENAPGSAVDSHWAVVYTPLPSPRTCAAGDTIVLHGWHDDTVLTLWADPDGEPAG